ncbi:hypothetical protein K450DRAFT_240805 [Umbelopsis ramanniana AG]|uniref:Uncharacterized protein n=1 Tax=Umbelopsis ramanniana AG TaxID=1314678 RepID=A0AAD5EAG4_UMBRA|nr:uncharacterized protein K450DRAFT_240805 [Umbelopsis ramanniana AG]KAI8579649.1 hypothetical protein K450DRAFT_240805 [Umbelopsis ramanniana AG]
MLHYDTVLEPQPVASHTAKSVHHVITDDMQEMYMSSDEETTTTFSTVAAGDSANMDHDMESPMREESYKQFQHAMESATDTHVSTCKSTYFFDGGKRFISLPTLGNSNIKAASLVSRMFEHWLENKICHTSHTDQEDHVPILEDSVELCSEDIMNTLKQKGSVRAFNGLSHVLVKIRAGHAYFYHQLDDGQPLLSQDMEDFFQQFPLFVEVTIHVKTLDTKRLSPQQPCKVLLSMENMGINATKPYRLMEEIHLS